MKVLGVILIIIGIVLSVIPFISQTGGSLFLGIILLVIGGVLAFRKTKE